MTNPVSHQTVNLSENCAEVPTLKAFSLNAVVKYLFLNNNDLGCLPIALEANIHRSVKKEIEETRSLISGLGEIYLDTSNLHCPQAEIIHGNLTYRAILSNSIKLENLLTFNQKLDSDLIKNPPPKESTEYTDQELVDLPHIEITQLLSHTKAQDQILRLYSSADLSLLDDEKLLEFNMKFRDLLLIKLRTLTENLSDEKDIINSIRPNLYSELTEKDHLIIDLKRKAHRFYSNSAHLNLIYKTGNTLEEEPPFTDIFETSTLFAEKYANQAFRHYSFEDLDKLPVFLWGKVYDALKQNNVKAHDLHTRYGDLAKRFEKVGSPANVTFCKEMQTLLAQEITQLALKIGLVESVYT